MRTRQQMEARVLHVVERAALRKSGDEDSFVELKEILPEDHRKAARQIAAICNAARGNEVLWIIGVRGKTGEVVGVADSELQAWWAQVGKCFDDFPPEMSSIVVPVNDSGRVVVGLFFVTDRPPYVIKSGAGSGVEREVPWRDGTRTRSAYRTEILKMVLPEHGSPKLEVLSAVVIGSFGKTRESSSPGAGEPKIHDAYVNFGIDVTIFVDTTHVVTFPQHRQSLTLGFPGTALPVLRAKPSFADVERHGPFIDADRFGALVKKPTAMTLSGYASMEVEGLTPREQDMSVNRIHVELLSVNLALEMSIAVSGDSSAWSHRMIIPREKKAPLLGYELHRIDWSVSSPD